MYAYWSLRGLESINAGILNCFHNSEASFVVQVAVRKVHVLQSRVTGWKLEVVGLFRDYVHLPSPKACVSGQGSAPPGPHVDAGTLLFPGIQHHFRAFCYHSHFTE